MLYKNSFYDNLLDIYRVQKKPMFTNVTDGTTVYVMVTKQNYSDRTGSGTVTITPKAVTITVNNASKVYGTADPDFSGTVEGLVGADDLGVISYQRTNTAEGVGLYENVLDASYTPNDNYTVIVEKGNFTITAADTMTVSADNVVKTYDGHGYGVSATSNVAEATVKYWNEVTSAYDLDASPAIANVSDSVLTVKFQASHPNYVTVTGQATVTITPKAVTITVNNASKVYGTADPDFSGTVDGLVAEGDLGKVSYSRINTAEGVGLYENVLEASYTPNDNYTVIVEKGNFTITAADTMTVSADNVVKTYDGHGYGVSATSNVAEATVKYWNEVTSAYDLDASPAIANVSDSVLTVKFQASHPNYVTVTGQATVTITPKAVTITVNNASKVYGTADPDFSGTVDGLVAEGDLGKVSYSRINTAEGVGLYENVLEASYTPNDNYTVIVEKGNFTITAADTMTVSADNVVKTYDGHGYGVSATSNVAEATVKYWNEVTSAYDLDASPAIANVSDSVLTVKFQASHPNYVTVTGQATVTINPKVVTITVNNASKVYGTADPDFSGTVEGLVGADDLGVISYQRTNTAEGVGLYENVLEASYTPNGNYTVTVEKGNFTITVAYTMTVSADNVVKTYDGHSYGVSATSNVAEATVKYWNEATEEYDLDASPAIANVSDSVLTVKFQASHPNYVTVTGQATVTINPKVVTITVNNASKVYGTADPDFSGTVEGLVGADDLGVISYQRTNTAEGVGLYENVLEASYTPNDNYTVIVEKGNFTITAATGAGLDITSYTGVYDAAAHSINVENAIDEDTVYYSIDGEIWSEYNPTFIDVTTGITVYVKVENPNYNDRTGSGMVTITARPIEITAASATKRHDGTALTQEDYSLTGGTLAEGDRLISVTVTGSQTKVGSSANVASDAVIMLGGEVDVTGNYDITYKNGILTVTRRSSSDDDPPEIIIPPTTVPLGPALEKDVHFAYIIGYPDNTVRPQNNITREEVSAVFYRLLEANYRNSIKTTSSDFPDVEADRWSSYHIGTLANGNIIVGYPDGTFRPGNYITRAEVAVIASKFDKLTPMKSDKFSDVSGHWAEEFIYSAAQKGWVKGYPDGTFKPDQYITRAEFATLVNNVLERRVKAEDLLAEARQFPDLEEDAWHYEAMQEAINSHNYERKDDGYEEWIDIYYPELDM